MKTRARTRHMWAVMVLAGGWFLWNVPLAEAQRGMGDAAGVARSGAEIERLVVSGTLEKIVTEPCAKTTGWSTAGTHLVIAAGEQETWNVHLGPTIVVESMIEKLTEGMQITVDAFRTAKLPEDACVACALTFDDEEIVLRDETLRPVWAGGGRGMGGGGRGFGRGGGWNSPGPCGRGGGGGWGAGGGGGRGRGAGMGRGWGWNY